MVDWLTQFDTRLFLFVNVGLANSFFDWLMPIITEFRNWAPVIVAGLAAIAWFGGGKGRTVALTAIVLIVITDQLASQVIKPWIGRLRPCHVVEGARILYRCSNTFAFPSSHATSTMAATVFFGLIYRRLFWPLAIASVLVSFSRVYLGVHYPLDVFGGWLLGGGLAWGMVVLYRSQVQPYCNRFRFLCDVASQE